MEEAEEANNGPKDISLFCASVKLEMVRYKQNPQVRIVDLDKDLVAMNVCL